MVEVIFNITNSFNTFPNYVKFVNDNYKFVNSGTCFGSLSKTNVFIGENNSGKSRFLRHLFANEFFGLNDMNFNSFFNSFDEKRMYDSYEVIPSSNVKRFEKIYDYMTRNRNISSQIEYNFFDAIEKCAKNYKSNNKFYFPIIRGSKNYKDVIEQKLNSYVATSKIKETDSIQHYIKLLSLEESGLNSFDIYQQIIKKEYFDKQNNIGEILTGGSLYNEIKSKLLGEEQDRKLIESFQEFLRDNFFEEYDKVQLIPNEKRKTLCVKIGSDEHAIYDLGDGTQQLIIILYSLFKHKDKEGCLFFIEEPEMYLHPGILRKFIEVINSDIFSNHQYFITTHSNIILDVSAETDVNMSIFKFKKVKNKENSKDKTFVIEQCNKGDASLLNDLGVRNSSVFLSNCSVWVEGISDRLYLKHFLKLFTEANNLKSFREGIDYTFIEYGGGNLVHFNFDEEDKDNNINAKYISNNVFLIADNDNTIAGEAKHERKEHLREVLGDNFYELPVVEIENLIKNDILKELLILDNPKCKEIIEEKFDLDKDYAHLHLGEYLDSVFADTNMRKYSTASGTIKEKLRFCKLVIQLVTDYEMLSDNAKQLIEKVYTFIEKHNSI